MDLLSVTGLAHKGYSCAALAGVIFTAGCHSGGARVVPSSAQNVSGSSAVTVAGDTPEEFAANLQAARAARKSVRIVAVSARLGVDDYSAYAQIVRSNRALFVRVYGRIHVYDIDEVQISYPPGNAVDLRRIPLVETPTVDAALASKNPIGATSSLRAQLCPHCDLVLLRPTGTAQSSTLWADAKDPWQKNPDYVYWSPGIDAKLASGQRGAASLVLNPCVPGYICCPGGYGYIGPYCYYPGGGGPGPYPIYFARLPRAQYNLTAEAACRQQKGRYADFWLGPDIPGQFYCQHETDTASQNVGGLYIDNGCFITADLPAKADPMQPIIVTVIGPTLTPSKAVDSVGVRVDMTRCYWTKSN
ncbi:MAG: hypothetical protein JO036_04190 [Candidatus Eremiobacteraeota bacterium]|nr:hypothetical protein [Candidatus Eremiobacteraeota bacterium]